MDVVIKIFILLTCYTVNVQTDFWTNTQPHHNNVCHHVGNFCNNPEVAQNCPHQCALTCMSCDKVLDPRDCNNATRCHQGQRCAFAKFIDIQDQKEYYRFGCADQTQIKETPLLPREVFGSCTALEQNRKRSSHYESGCCDETLCNAKIFNMTKLSCYKCQTINHPENCNHKVACNAGEKCAISKNVHVHNLSANYLLGCASQDVCNSFNHTKRSSIQLDAACCDYNGCNNQFPVLDQEPLKCLSCHSVSNPNDCTTISTCRPGQQCGVTWNYDVHGGTFRFQCTDSDQCTNNTHCCSTSLCNTRYKISNQEYLCATRDQSVCHQPNGHCNEEYAQVTCPHACHLCDSCPLDFNRIGHSCYFFNIQNLSHHDAQTVCDALGGDLALIVSEYEEELLHNFIQNKYANDNSRKHYWIQGYSQSSYNSTLSSCISYQPGQEQKFQSETCSFTKASNFICKHR